MLANKYIQVMEVIALIKHLLMIIKNRIRWIPPIIGFIKGSGGTDTDISPLGPFTINTKSLERKL